MGAARTLFRSKGRRSFKQEDETKWKPFRHNNEHEAEWRSVYTLESLVTKCGKSYLPEPARMRSDRVKAPGRSLLFPLMNSLLNLG
jgi:rRNA maturation protein Nop10